MDQIKILKLLVTWVVVALALLIGTQIAKGSIILGNTSLTAPMAGIFNAFILTALLSMMPSFVSRMNLKIRNDQKFSWSVYFLANLVMIWLLKRLATITGLGISNIYLVIVIALAVTLLEMFVEKYLSDLIGKS